MRLLTILGPTASGKTTLGVTLARRFGGEIISADSRQVYRGMDIGTGKDLGEYGDIPYHLIDIRDPREEFDLFTFQRMALDTIGEIQKRGRLPLVVGGTGLYLQSLLAGHRLVEVPVDPLLRGELASKSDGELVEILRAHRGSLHNTTDTADRDRLLRAVEIARYTARHPPEPLPPFHRLTIGIRIPRDRLRERIKERLLSRVEAGLIEEVASLHARGVSWERLDSFGLEYRYVGGFLRGETGRGELITRLTAAICDFAKRQETWFRRMERHGIPIRWVDGEGDPAGESTRLVEEWLSTGATLCRGGR